MGRPYDQGMEEWGPTDEEMETWLAEWEEVDRAAADYLAERLPEVLEPVGRDEEPWFDAIGETISPSDEPAEEDVHAVSSVMALEHADWLGLVLGVVRRGPGAPLEAEDVQADVDALDEVEGEIEDPEGHLDVLEMALLHLTPRWQRLGVLDDDERFTAAGVRALPRVLHRIWVS